MLLRQCCVNYYDNNNNIPVFSVQAIFVTPPIRNLKLSKYICSSCVVIFGFKIFAKSLLIYLCYNDEQICI